MKESRYRTLVREHGIALLPGVEGWLHALRQSGWRQAVASSAPPENIAVLLEVLHLQEVFDRTVSAEEVAHGKPHPDVFLRAAEKLGVAPDRCVVVEDAPSASKPAAVEACERSASPACTADLTPMS